MGFASNGKHRSDRDHIARASLHTRDFDMIHMVDDTPLNSSRSRNLKPQSGAAILPATGLQITSNRCQLQAEVPMINSAI